MVLAGDGRIHGVDAVFHDAHPRAGQAMHHRATGSLAEGGGVDARLIVQRRADARFGLATQLFALHHGGGVCQPLARQRVGVDLDDFEVVCRSCGGGTVWLLGEGCVCPRHHRRGGHVSEQFHAFAPLSFLATARATRVRRIAAVREELEALGGGALGGVLSTLRGRGRWRAASPGARQRAWDWTVRTCRPLPP